MSERKYLNTCHSKETRRNRRRSWNKHETNAENVAKLTTAAACVGMCLREGLKSTRKQPEMKTCQNSGCTQKPMLPRSGL